MSGTRVYRPYPRSARKSGPSTAGRSSSSPGPLQLAILLHSTSPIPFNRYGPKNYTSPVFRLHRYHWPIPFLEKKNVTRFLFFFRPHYIYILPCQFSVDIRKCVQRSTGNDADPAGFHSIFTILKRVKSSTYSTLSFAANFSTSSRGQWVGANPRSRVAEPTGVANATSINFVQVRTSPHFFASIFSVFLFLCNPYCCLLNSYPLRALPIFFLFMHSPFEFIAF